MTTARNSSRVHSPISSGSSRLVGRTYFSAAIAPPSPWIGRSCYFVRPQERSDRRRHSGRDDRNAGPGTNPDPDRDSDLPHGKATRRQRDNAAGKAEHGDDLAARTLEEVGELGERGIEGGIGAGDRKSTRLNSSH